MLARQIPAMRSGGAAVVEEAVQAGAHPEGDG
jgi:hypothetical protein